jgi:hypothetical protein
MSFMIPTSTPTQTKNHPDASIFQASGAFIAACQDATLALHALTAQIKALQSSLPKVDKANKTSVAAGAVKKARRH